MSTGVGWNAMVRVKKQVVAVLFLFRRTLEPSAPLSELRRTLEHADILQNMKS
jgi:hypothetical protein